ncbi:unnamed protein product [Lampetra fluviatilis]
MSDVKDQQEKEEEEDLRSVLVTSVLTLEKIDQGLYRGSHPWVPRSKTLFGGQIVGQALVAAGLTVAKGLHAHSLHCYFVRPGDPRVPVLYQVDLVRDGRSFSVRSVRAVQHGLAIFVCQASFQLDQPSPMEHQCCMPDVPLPESLLTWAELIDKAMRDPLLSERHRLGLSKILAKEVPIEIRPVIPIDYVPGTPLEPRQLFWVRAKGHIGEGDMNMHRCVAAYISDYSFVRTAWHPHVHMPVRSMASLDHSMWFHAPFRADEWMLYECESPWAGHSRGLVLGRLWRRDGTLAVSCAQEGVFRLRQKAPGAAPASKL